MPQKRPNDRQSAFIDENRTNQLEIRWPGPSTHDLYDNDIL